MKFNSSLILLAILLLVACQGTDEVVAYEAIEYEVFMGDTPAGYQKNSLAQDGNYQFEFEFNDRGRGPHLEETIQVDESGNIRQIIINGHNYLKDTVNEVYTFNAGNASWKSSAEEGSTTAEEDAFYMAVNSTFGSTELMAKKLLASKDQSISLLPSGSAKITNIQEISLGDSLDLKLIEVSGMAFTPSYIWLDDANRFFASVSTWLSCIRKGYNAMRPHLLATQTEQELAFYKNLATELTQIPTKQVVIQNANIFDPKTGKISPKQTIIIDENKIVGIQDEAVSIPENAQVIDATDKTVLPGLFDMHAHIFRPDGILNLAAGVTSVRDLANSMDLLNIKKEFENNDAIGPRIPVMCGFIDQAGPYAGPIGKIIKTLDEGLEAIDFYQENGFQQIKLYSSIDPDWVKPLAERAHQKGLRVSGHIPSYMLAEDAVKSGYDEIQHVNMVALNFLPDTIDTRTPLRFSMIAEHTHDLDLQGPEFKSLIKLLQEKEIVVDPTVSIFEGMFTAKAGEADPQFKAIIERLPVQVQRGFYSGGLPIPEGKEEQYKKSYQKLLDIVYALYENGITIVAGTDALAGFALHGELASYVRAGIPTEEVLKIATITSAEIVGMADQLGSIEVGKLADLILVDGNPVDQISDIRKVALTIKDGKIYDPKALYEAIGIKHYQ